MGIGGARTGTRFNEMQHPSSSPTPYATALPPRPRSTLPSRVPVSQPPFRARTLPSLSPLGFAFYFILSVSYTLFNIGHAAWGPLSPHPGVPAIHSWGLVCCANSVGFWIRPQPAYNQESSVGALGCPWWSLKVTVTTFAVPCALLNAFRSPSRRAGASVSPWTAVCCD